LIDFLFKVIQKEREEFMLAGPDLLVILVIALIIFGPKKLPELAKTIGKAMAEIKKTTEEVKESIGINELREMKSNLTMDLYTVAEKLSASMTSEEIARESSSHEGGSVQERPPLIEEASNDIGKLEKEKSAELEGPRDNTPGKGVHPQG
jgi:TatA/E family protein of Tat protein translocase